MRMARPRYMTRKVIDSKKVERNFQKAYLKSRGNVSNDAWTDSEYQNSRMEAID